MRKYQQLILLLLTIGSVTVLVMYKKENARLKYVLDVVNFFGRSDVDALLKMENISVATTVFDLGYPLATWQWMGSDFHAYSAFWRQRIGGGGEVVVIAAGLSSAVVNFKCFVRFHDRGKMKGKFGFSRVKEDSNDEFSVYKFVCKYDGQLRKVAAVTFTDVVSLREHTLSVRDIQSRTIKDKIHLAVCLDLTTIDANLDSFTNITTLQQFFFHYHIIGADEFIVYGSDGMTSFVRARLQRYGIQPNVFPFNFPFAKTTKNRAIIELDCLYRTSNVAEYAVVVGLNEYYYPYTAKFKPNTPFNDFLSQFPADTTRYEIAARNICIYPRNMILSDNNLAELTSQSDDQRYYLHRPQFDHEIVKSVVIERKRLAVNRYINCTDGANLFDWRNLIDDASLSYINTVSKQLNLLLMQ